MRIQSAEFGNQYRVGQLLPSHAIAMRESAVAKGYTSLQTLDAKARVSILDDEGKLSVTERTRIDANRSIIFPRIRR